MYNYNSKKNEFNDASYCSKNSTQNGKKLPVEDDEIENFGTRPEISIFVHQLVKIYNLHNQVSYTKVEIHLMHFF